MRHARLSRGDMAPKLQTSDWKGRPFDLASLRGGPVFLSFYRYASCPLCNLRIHQLIAAHNSFAAKGLTMVAVFQSPAESIARYVGRQVPPFVMIPDPEMRFYRRFGVETSWLGFMRAWTIGIGRPLRAVLGKGFMPGMIEGNLNRIPADFLIGADGTLVDVFYGKDIGDHMPLQRLHDGLRVRTY